MIRESPISSHGLFGDRQIPPRKIPPGRFHPGCFPPTKPGFAKYAVDANLFPLESSMLAQAKRATNRNNAATNRKKTFGFFGGNIRWGNIPGWSLPRTVYLSKQLCSGAGFLLKKGVFPVWLEIAMSDRSYLTSGYFF